MSNARNHCSTSAHTRLMLTEITTRHAETFEMMRGVSNRLTGQFINGLKEAAQHETLRDICRRMAADFRRKAMEATRESPLVLRTAALQMEKIAAECRRSGHEEH